MGCMPFQFVPFLYRLSSNNSQNGECLFFRVYFVCTLFYLAGRLPIFSYFFRRFFFLSISFVNLLCKCCVLIFVEYRVSIHFRIAFFCAAKALHMLNNIHRCSIIFVDFITLTIHMHWHQYALD